MSTKRPAEPRTGYLDTLWASVNHRKTLALAIPVSFAYLLLFVYFSGVLSRVPGSQFPGAQDFPHFEIFLSPIGYMPYLAFQPTPHWYLEVNLIQAGELVIIGGLVAVNVALAGFIWRLHRRPGRQASSVLAGVVPLFVTNGACVACAGIPAGLAFLPGSLAGGLLAFAQFYGIAALLAIPVLGAAVLYHLERANNFHDQQNLCYPT